MDKDAVVKKFYVHENAVENLSKIYFLKNAKKTCKPKTAVEIAIVLEKISINSKFLDIIHAMYKEPNSLLLYKGKVTEPFYLTIGLKQGDMFSTIFVNLFVNNFFSRY